MSEPVVRSSYEQTDVNKHIRELGRRGLCMLCVHVPAMCITTRCLTTPPACQWSAISSRGTTCTLALTWFMPVNQSINQLQIYIALYVKRRRGSATGRVLDLRSVGRGFKSYLRQRCATTLGKLFTPMCLCHQAV